MAEVAQLIPDEPLIQATVRDVLKAHPELTVFIDKVAARARSAFTDASMSLDTVGYDDWDPPIRLIIRSPMPWSEYPPVRNKFVRWLEDQPDYNQDLIFVFPQWAGDIDSAQ